MTVSGDPLFTFAVVADTHMRPEEGDESSPFPVNEMANDRARYVVSLLNDLKPDFIIHLGDIVHPVPVLPTYGAACEAAKAALGGLDAPIRYIPGNHDVGDKPNPQMPAAGISDANMDAYEAQFGETWSSVDKDNCHFTLLNAQLMNSGLAREKRKPIGWSGTWRRILKRGFSFSSIIRPAFAPRTKRPITTISMSRREIGCWH
ncbi:MAG: metallophosphoesterase [Proteobacteria bacterium]|nr:metallophosphoesterase [Pseudomonadota bacterium]